MSAVAVFWSRAPFVNAFLDAANPQSWPDPWHLIVNGQFDDLAICLGMLYTIKLTQRFTDINCEIHKSMQIKNNTFRFFLVAQQYVLNYEPRIAHDLHVLDQIQTTVVWNSTALPINIK